MGLNSDLRNFIKDVPDGQMFSTRDVLTFGTRKGIDQFMHLMVRARTLIRLANGVFMRNTGSNYRPGLEEIARYKAKGFNKTLYVHGVDAAKQCQLIPQYATGDEKALPNGNLHPTYAASGSTTSFKTIRGRVTLKGTSSRDLRYGDAPVGLVIRAFKKIGLGYFARIPLTCALAKMPEDQLKELCCAAGSMTWWMSNYFVKVSALHSF